MLRQPDIIISSSDYDRLHSILHNLPRTEAVSRLIDEIDRAEIVADDSLPSDVVSMNSKVTFTAVSTHKTFTYTLVYPENTAPSDRLSVLTPVGSALIGLSVGQEIEWPIEKKGSTKVRIDAVMAPEIKRTSP